MFPIQERKIVEIIQGQRKPFSCPLLYLRVLVLKTLCTTFEVARITEAIWLLLGMKWGSEYVCAMPRRVMKAIRAKH